ncbi:EamA family transporter [Halobacteriovorax marinus]|uniref:EamA family transporter n=1 Tax=Halobacteriovorax marinus TaxID=97084 RepID=A0A1Y5F7G5_9BACT|nr:EamA family transporter [Halobacteriovorax marinus]
MENVYLYGLGANLAFALGSQVFTIYARKISSAWMNCFKALIGLMGFGLFVSLFSTWHSIDLKFFLLFFTSGFIGLGVGDIFLLKAFSKMGPGRTLMLFGFQPLIIGILSYFIFGQVIDSMKFWAILFFILCLGTFSLESFKKKGHWDISSISIAFIGMSLDAIGVIITRYSFDHNPTLSAMEGNFHRCIGALSVFILLSIFKPFDFIAKWKTQKSFDKKMLIFGSLLGTFLSLALYLKAMQTAHLATLSGIAITGTIFSSLFESIIEKKWPSRYLLMAFVFFLCGMKFLIL